MQESHQRVSAIPWRVLLTVFVRRSLLLLLLLCVLFQGCSQENSHNASATPAGNKPVPVRIGQAVMRDIPLDVHSIGSVEPISRVSVKAQVNGELLKVHFTEGQKINKGDLLFTLDSRMYQAELSEAEANRARDMTQLKLAQERLKRYEDLSKSGVVAADKRDEVKALADSLATTIKSNEAIIESVKLQIDYCTIRSPIDGYAGSVLVHAGNLVKANDTQSLVEINQIQPIHVSFTIPERYLLDIRQNMQEGDLPVRVEIPGIDTMALEGKLVFVDNAIDRAAGTLRLKALYENDTECLWPGQFVNVTLTLATQTGMILVPSEAVQISQQGQFVYVVKPDSKVDFRLVKTDRIIGVETVVLEGLEAGETIVVDGQSRLAPNSAIEVKDAAVTASAAKEQT